MILLCIILPTALNASLDSTEARLRLLRTHSLDHRDVILFQKLSIIRCAESSDSQRIASLEMMRVFSNVSISYKSEIMMPFFEPEYWCYPSSRRYKLRMKSKYKTPRSIDFFELPIKSRVAVMASRIIIQAIYPFFTDINEISKYLEMSECCATEHIQYNSSHYFKLAPTSLYREVSRLKPLVYFAALYYQQIMHENRLDTNSSSNSSIIYELMDRYKFVNLSKETIQWIKCEYFRSWQHNKMTAYQHMQDLVEDHVRYWDILYLSSFDAHEDMINEMKQKVTTLAIVETFDVIRGNYAGIITSQQSMELHIYQILQHALYQVARNRRDLCRRLSRVLRNIGGCSREELLLFINVKNEETVDVRSDFLSIAINILE